MTPTFTIAPLAQMQQKAFAVTENLKASELSIPKDLKHLSAQFKGQEVNMYSYAWETEIFKRIRITILLIPGRLETFNFVLYPQNHFDAPVFASDFVVSNDKLRIGMIDWMPIFKEESDYIEEWIEPLAPLYETALEIAPQYDRKLAWSTQFTSRYACLATGITSKELPPLVKLWKQYLDLYLAKTEDIQLIDFEREEDVADWHYAYNQAHLKVENERNPYMVYFGDELGSRYNAEFLFVD